jgi:hypothetical protein
VNVRPLPRSLDPLSDEALPGFLLRLSHRMELPPSRVAALTGLSSASRRAMPLLQLRAPAALAAAFARATRLSQAEVAALGLDSLRHCYPPLQLQYSAEGRNFVRRDKNLPPVRGWLLRHHSRFCPQCLGGDGSPIQNTHGGAWRRSWRLAVVFSCPRHRRLLQSRCPGCAVPALHRSPRAADLLSASGEILHPAQCRAILPAASDGPGRLVCGARLDGAGPDPADRGLPFVLAFQERLLARLRLDQPERRGAGDSRYFYDLHLIMRLIRRSWPFAARFAAPELDLGLIDGHVAELDHEVSRLRAAGQQVSDLRLRGGPAADPRTCGHLLALADQLRTDGDALTELVVSVEGDSLWFRELEQFLRHCSPRMRTAAREHVAASLPQPRPVKPAPRRRSRPGPGAAQPARGGRQWPPMGLDLRLLQLGLHHIPQHLPEHHLQPVTDLVDGPAALLRSFRRFAAITMAQAASDLTVEAAGAALGFPAGWGANARRTVRRWADAHDRHDELQAALNQVIDRLNTEPLEINYRARRSALAGWRIPAGTWRDVSAELRAQHRRRNQGIHSDWGPDKHRATSLLLWVVMTRGDYLAAPLFRDATAPNDRVFIRTAQRLMFYLGNPPPAPGRGEHVFDLLDAFADLRAEVEHAVDAGAVPPS